MQNDTHSPQKAKEHYKQGVYYCFVQFDRVLAMYHFGQSVRYQPGFVKGWYFYALSMFVPSCLIRPRQVNETLVQQVKQK